MQTNDIYMTFGEIQENICKHYERYGKGINFRDSMIQLKNAEKYHIKKPDVPDFLSWDMKKKSVLRSLIYQIPIAFSDVFCITPQLNPETNSISLPAKSPVQINLESFYSPPCFTVLPYFSVIYVMQGSCFLHTDREHYHMKAGELALLTPEVPYRVDVTPGNMVFTILSNRTHFEDHFFPLLQKDNVLSAFFRNALFLSKTELLFFMLTPNMEIRNLIRHLFQEFVVKDNFSTDMFRNYLQIFYTQIIRSHENTYRYYEKNQQVDARNNIPAILQYMRDNYACLTLELLAQHFHYSAPYLSKIIKETTGKNYTDIITSFKLTEAKELLKNSPLSITEISSHVGYNSADHFTHAFRQNIGISPREYRKRI